MKNNKAKLNFDNNTLEIVENHTVTTISKLSISEGLVRTLKAVTIPKFSQTLIRVSVSHQQPGSTVLLEPLPNIEHLNVLAAKSLVTVKNGKAYISLLNPTDKNVRLRAHKKIAKVEQVNTELIQNFEENSPSVSSVNTPSKVSGSDLEFDLSQSDLTEIEKTKLKSFLKENRKSFATNLTELGETDVYKHKIVTVPGARPVKQHFYRQSPQVKKEMENQIQDLLKHNIIKESNSDWLSPVVMIPKKNTGTWRLAIDYRKVNKVTVPMNFPLPHIESDFDTLGEAKPLYFTNLDLKSSFWQIPLDEETKHKSAFVTQSGVYELWLNECSHHFSMSHDSNI